MAVMARIPVLLLAEHSVSEGVFAHDLLDASIHHLSMGDLFEDAVFPAWSAAVMAADARRSLQARAAGPMQGGA